MRFTLLLPRFQQKRLNCLFAFQLTPDKVASGLAVLLSEEVGLAAQRLALRMNAEDGVTSSLDAFYSHLHLETMVCDVSLFLGESRLAQVWCRECGFKMNKEVCDIVHASSNHHNIKVTQPKANYL